tara:strand:- start:605 stop:766 length:162 start_codon:yes stop_codon:yes gene_type:complete
MKLNIIKRSWEQVDKKGRKTLWEWDEGPELRAFIQRQATNQLHSDIKENAKRN